MFKMYTYYSERHTAIEPSQHIWSVTRGGSNFSFFPFLLVIRFQQHRPSCCLSFRLRTQNPCFRTLALVCLPFSIRVFYLVRLLLWSSVCFVTTSWSYILSGLYIKQKLLSLWLASALCFLYISIQPSAT